VSKLFEGRVNNFVIEFLCHTRQVGNHDNGRVKSRFDEKFVDAMNMIVMLLPGTPVTYYGEELGLADGPQADEAKKDPMGRDIARGPMPWDKGFNAGLLPRVWFLPLIMIP
jgi:glycosidase